VPNQSLFARLEAKVETMAGMEAERKKMRTKQTRRKGKDVERGGGQRTIRL
jgi:hypothetical protein